MHHNICIHEESNNGYIRFPQQIQLKLFTVGSLVGLCRDAEICRYILTDIS